MGLLSGSWISASVPGVDDHITVICIVFVATGENDRLRSLGLASRDTRLSRYVYPAFVEFCAIFEEASFRITRHVSEESINHARAYRITCSRSLGNLKTP